MNFYLRASGANVILYTKIRFTGLIIMFYGFPLKNQNLYRGVSPEIPQFFFADIYHVIRTYIRSPSFEIRTTLLTPRK